MASLASAPLYALAKKDGGLRPIAVGETLRRLVSKCCCHASKAMAASFLSPLQVGVGVPGGCEAVIHAVAAAIEEHGHNSDMVMLKIDFTNAFNRIQRPAFLKLLSGSDQFGGLYRWARACYGIRSSLLFGPHCIDSLAGVQQGDPLGPLLFSLVLQTLVQKIKDTCPALALNVWFLDDGTLIGKTDDVLRAVEIIRAEGPGLGMMINPLKCELWWPVANPRMHEFDEVFKRIDTTGVALLGCALGGADFVAAHLEKRVRKAEEALETLALFEDSQMELLLLRSCLGLPKLGYSMRTTPPHKIGVPLERFGGLLSESLSRILGDSLSAAASTQAALPISWGGLGILDAELTAKAAFLSSSFQTQELQAAILGKPAPVLPGVHEALQALYETLPVPSTPEEAAARWSVERLGAAQPRQRTLLEPLYEVTHAKLVDGGSEPDKARLRACVFGNNGVFLNALPVPWMRLDSREMSIACRLRLGLPVYKLGVARVCPECHSCQITHHGYHSLICPSNGDRISRHNHLCDVLAGFTRSCATGVVKVEARGLIPGANDKPGDVTLTNWLEGRTAAFDITVVSPVCQSYVKKAALASGHAASAAEARKDTKAYDKCAEQGLEFVPLAVEVFGGWGAIACEAFRKLAGFAANRSGKTRAEEYTFFLQRMAIALQRDNAHMVQSRGPIYIPQEDMTPPP